MKTETIKKLRMVSGDNASQFEAAFNSTMEELAEYQPEPFFYDSEPFLARIIYSEVMHIADSVADEFHAEGIRYLCKHCPHLEDPHDKRIKRCKCKYSELGITHKEHEACEMFYRQLKAGRLEPLADYMR